MISNHTEQNDIDDQYYYGDDADSKPTPDVADNKQKTTKNPWVILWMLISNPVEGWKELRRSRMKTSRMGRLMFYPLMAVTALTALFGPVYDADTTWVDAVLQVLVIFMTFLLANFAVILGLRIFMPASQKQRFDNEFCQCAVMAMLSTLMCGVLLWNVLPPLTPVVVFIPLYTCYLGVRLVKFLRVDPERHNTVAFRLCLLVVGCPAMFFYLFSQMLGQ